MRSAPWLVLGGAVAGFLGVLGLHRPASGALGQGPAQAVSTGGGSSTSGAVTGPVVPYGYGELATRVTISHGRITGVSVPVLKTAEQFSQQLAAQAIPVLRGEVLAAQSAHIQAVSGATYTSEAYAHSVQAALDKAHLK
jgi:FMN-binding domain